MVKQIYLVMGSGGEYESFTSWPVKGFADEALAKDWAQNATQSAKLISLEHRKLQLEKRDWIEAHRTISREERSGERVKLRVNFIDVTEEEFVQKLQEFQARAQELSNPYDTEHWGGSPDDNDTYDYSIIEYDDSTPSPAQADQGLEVPA